MTRPARLALEADHLPLCYLALDLIEQNRVIEASYVHGIVQTELAEHRHPTHEPWPWPGQAAPKGWGIYQAALRWCRTANGTDQSRPRRT
jgi:hypothetical protein